MSITLTTDGTGDFSLHGYDNTGVDTSECFTDAKTAMEADSWSNDTYALMQAGHYTYAEFEGIGHLEKDPATFHLQKVASGHLNKDLGERLGAARCIALADRCHVSDGDIGTSVTSVKVNFSATVSGMSTIPGYTAQFWFKTTNTTLPDDDWGWMTGSSKSLGFSTSVAATDITFSGVSLTLDHYFWCLYKLSTYAYPTYTYSGATPSGSYYTKTILVHFGLSNTYVINP
jgi:hypothetical protein